ncbi:MAG TPA: cytidine deaminase [Solirubrobacterales bacterium]|nr:cytidine deaminase [Solirubrobacterales bacterium]
MLQIQLSVSDAARERIAGIDVEALFERAREAMRYAYAPYSRFRVGAAILTEDGDVVGGSNLENSSYGLTICAERAAVARAVSEGHRRFRAIAVAVEGDGGTPAVGASCGACLQVLSEFSPGGDLVVAYPEGDSLQVASLSDLLPVRFSL